MPPRALILFPGALGDFICFLPALERLRQEFRLDLLAKTEFSELVASSVAVRSLECDEISRLFVPGAGERQELQLFFAAYAAIYSWFGSGQAVFASELRRASQRKARLFPFRPVGARMPQTDYYLSCLGQTTGAIPAVSIKSEAVLWCNQHWREHRLAERPVIALAPGSGALEKNWPMVSYRVVADWWRERVGGIVIVVLGPVEEERGGLDALCDRALVARGLTLGQLAALLSRCLLNLGNDSGTSHLAAAVGIRTVALFGPSDPLAWAPRGNKVTIVRKSLACSPCNSTTAKSCSHRSCLAALEPVDVIKRLEALPEFAALTRWGAEIRV
jgi:ADP-heptose:LPS heptosyltransferase